MRPTPRLGESITLTLPNLPPAMDGRTVLHISDLHVRRYRPWFRRVVAVCRRVQPDFVFMTGDYMTWPGDEPAAMKVLADLADALRPRHGTFASFGNHDSAAIKREAPTRLPQITWLDHNAAYLPAFGVTLIGTSTPYDMVSSLRDARRQEREANHEGDPYRIVLGHEPTILITCAELGIEWTLAGHTHGGQVRFLFPIALHNSTDLPATHSSGILRCRDSICTISRGLGESYFDVRLFCPPQLPLYILKRGDLPGSFNRRATPVRWW